MQAVSHCPSRGCFCDALNQVQRRQHEHPFSFGLDAEEVALLELAEDVGEQLLRWVVAHVVRNALLAAGAVLTGPAVFPVDGLTVEALMKRADLAMCDAKRNGRDRLGVTLSGQDAAPPWSLWTFGGISALHVRIARVPGAPPVQEGRPTRAPSET